MRGLGKCVLCAKFLSNWTESVLDKIQLKKEQITFTLTLFELDAKIVCSILCAKSRASAHVVARYRKCTSGKMSTFIYAFVHRCECCAITSAHFFCFRSGNFHRFFLLNLNMDSHRSFFRLRFIHVEILTRVRIVFTSSIYMYIMCPNKTAQSQCVQ